MGMGIRGVYFFSGVFLLQGFIFSSPVELKFAGIFKYNTVVFPHSHIIRLSSILCIFPIFYLYQ